MQEMYENEDYYDGSLEHRDQDGLSDDDMRDDDDEFNKNRSKRRSKNDNVGRTFTCGCGKSYLSYPALYTHIKQKHNGVTPEGTLNAQIHTGRGRGRPRKDKTTSNIEGIIQTEQLDDMKEKPNVLQSQLGKELTSEMLEHESDLLSNVSFALKPRIQNSLLGAIGSEGNNFNALSWYAREPCEEDHLFQVIRFLYEEIENELSQIQAELNFEKKEGAGQSTQYLLLVPDEDRVLFTIDQVLALYLIDLADLIKLNRPTQPEVPEPVTKNGQKKEGPPTRIEVFERNNYQFYMTACCFVQLYRGCINDSIHNAFKDRPLNIESEYSQSRNYTSDEKRSPECIPLICNEFLTEYLPLKCNIFDLNTAIGFTQHMVTWLYDRKFTRTKIDLINSN